MSFHDLPDDWSDLPIEALDLTDVVDLFVPVAERANGCLLVLVVGEDGRILQPVMIGDVPLDADPASLTSGLWPLVELVREHDGGVVVARGRLGSAQVVASDSDWAAAMELVFGDLMRGCFVATTHGVLPVAQRALIE